MVADPRRAWPLAPTCILDRRAVRRLSQRPRAAVARAAGSARRV